MPRGGARAGAGRPRKIAAELPTNVIPFGPRPTLGQVLEALRPPVAPAGGVSPTSPMVPPAPERTDAKELNAPAPPLTSVPPLDDDDELEQLEPPAPTPKPANRMFAKMAASAATSVAVISFTKLIQKEGLEPNEPGDDDVEAAERATEEGIALAVGDTEIPWWAGMALAYGNLFVSMRVGAKRPSSSSSAALAKDSERPTGGESETGAEPAMVLPPPAPPAPPSGARFYRKGPAPFTSLPVIQPSAVKAAP